MGRQKFVVKSRPTVFMRPIKASIGTVIIELIMRTYEVYLKIMTVNYHIMCLFDF